MATSELPDGSGKSSEKHDDKRSGRDSDVKQTDNSEMPYRLAGHEEAGSQNASHSEGLSAGQTVWQEDARAPREDTSEKMQKSTQKPTQKNASQKPVHRGAERVRGRHRSGTHVVANRDYWVKVVGMLMQNYALIDEYDGKTVIWFLSERGGVFDCRFYPYRNGQDRAVRALERNGFWNMRQERERQEAKHKRDEQTRRYWRDLALQRPLTEKEQRIASHVQEQEQDGFGDFYDSIPQPCVMSFGSSFGRSGGEIVVPDASSFPPTDGIYSSGKYWEGE